MPHPPIAALFLQGSQSLLPILQRSLRVVLLLWAMAIALAGVVCLVQQGARALIARFGRSEPPDAPDPRLQQLADAATALSSRLDEIERILERRRQTPS